ncbi:GNAT family N-acetyltransferase [Tepidiforma thermophila]|uniref:Acetyltransferase (GNAT) family protein n=1 Tax=Tepidiforma thermophila (strain KCTC 52669 / CGMCC 1.13589 / G233) TaxID=2761530 RepID=A0A2A9HD22_TEPT2|nr:GNAT family N-acetyltransferase [Tepidiforma thermophila]PFG73061.1 acetyltransferase (GNAT) family protein [Tepidiforma thermophila]
MGAGEFRVVPYARGRHGDGPWRVVARVFEEYGFPFAEADYDADVLWPERHYREGWFLVAEAADGEVVGCVGLSDEGGGEFELHRLYVLPGARGKGLGERLTREVIGLARAAGARRLVLFSDVAFEHAHRLYERCGFRRNRFRYAPDPWRSREWGFVLEFEEER